MDSNDTCFIADSKQPSQAPHPWRRYFARGIDLSIYGIPWSLFLSIVLHVNLLNRGVWGNLLDAYAAFLIMLFIEPMLLHVFGTTPGKAIFGLRIESGEGRRLSYGEGLVRTWGVISRGYGFNIPIYNIVRHWKSYKTCTRNEMLPWDDYEAYTIKDTKRFRVLVYIAAVAVIAFISVVMAFAQRLPPNRGDLTIAQFVENYRKFTPKPPVY